MSIHTSHMQETHLSLIHSANIFSDTYHVAGTVRGPRDTVGNKMEAPCLRSVQSMLMANSKHMIS